MTKKFMTNYFNLLPTDLQIVIMNKIFDKFKMIYQTYKVHPTHLKYNGSSSYISFYNNYYVKNDQLPTAKYANTGDIVIDISYSQNHNSHILYEVRGFYNYEYLTNYRTMRCNYHKIIYNKTELFNNKLFLLVLRCISTSDYIIQPYSNYKVVRANNGFKRNTYKVLYD